jgi:6-phosphogluconolactonase
MANIPEVDVFENAPSLAKGVAQELCMKIAQLLTSKEEIHLILTGGTIGIRVLTELSREIASEEIDSTRMHFWWSDERFVSEDSPDRNEVQAREALLNLIDVNEEYLHPFESSDEMSIEVAAELFERELARFSEEDDIPVFDICLLGMGPDGHVASLFPKDEGIAVGRNVVIVKTSPKPPSLRLSLSFQALNSANEVWLIVSGEEKSEMVAGAIRGESSIPAARVSGRVATRWFLDKSASSLLD